MKHSKSPNLDNLRKRAEALLDLNDNEFEHLSQQDIRALIEDLRIHQIELEIQNEDLNAAQLSLAKTRDQYVQLFEFAPVGYVVINDSGIVLRANQTFAKMIHCDVSDVTNRPFSEFITQDEQWRFLSRFHAFWNNPQGKYYELPLQYQNTPGISVRVEGHRLGLEAFPFANTRPQETLFLSVTDITSLKESETRYRQLVHASPNAVIVHIDGEILFNNVAYHHLCNVGITTPLRGQNFLDTLPPESRNKAKQQIRATQHGQNTAPIELQFTRQDGALIDIEMQSVTTTYGGAQATMSIMRDVTEHKAFEQTQQRINHLESLGILAGGIAHDFNNLLTGITGNLAFLERETNAQEKQSLLKEARDAAHQMSQLTAQLMTFSKGGEPLKEITHVAKLITEKTEFCLHGTNCMATYDIDENLWSAEIDPGQIGQVIQNLVINANQAMPDGGTITVSANNIELPKNNTHALQAGFYVQITVEDTGTGMTPEDLSRIFDPYFTNKTDGQGLGLTIAHSVIQKHHGQISVTSQPNQGSCFTFFLPATGKQPQTHIEKSDKKDQTPAVKGRVLIMDDEELVFLVLKRAIEHMGCTCTITQNGNDAIKAYQEALHASEPYDVVIMDLTIPGGMGGKEAVQEIKKIHSEAKVIVSSGYSQDPIMANYEDYGFDARLVKPLDLTEVLRVLQDLLPP